MTSRIRRFAALPDVVGGAPIDDSVSVVIPVGRTNEISTNPSAEINSVVGYTAGAGVLDRTTAQQYHGAYSWIYTPSAALTDGFYLAFSTTIAVRAISCKFLGLAGIPYALAVASTAPAELVTATFRATGRWQWIWLFFNESSATTRRIYIRKNGSASVAPFYVDGIQSEVCGAEGTFVTTYIDGDQLGLLPSQFPPAYGWNGAPHLSSSWRSGLTNAGGRVVPLAHYNLTLTALLGLGMAVPQNVATEYARVDGAYPDYVRKPTRAFSVVGQIQAPTQLQLRTLRGQLAAVLDRDRSALDQPIVLRHHRIDACGDAASSVAAIACKYAGGLDGNVQSGPAEAVSLQFVQYLPLVAADAEAGSSLSLSTTVANTKRIAQRTSAGAWRALGTGAADNEVRALAYGADGSLYAGGSFTSMGGVANTRGIAKWDGSAWSALGTGTSVGGTVYALAVGPNGVLYAAGDFTSMGGVANTSRIAQWTGSAWSALSTGLTGGGIVRGRALAVGADGAIYVGGLFTAAGGGAAANIAQWSGSAWSALGSGMDDEVLALTRGPGGTVAAGGKFVTAGGGAAVHAASWDGSAWSALGSPNLTQIDALVYGPNALLYAGGQGAPYIEAYNGATWQAVGGGLSAAVEALAMTGDGLLYAGGAFTLPVAGAIPTGGLALWNGATWLALDVSRSGATVYALLWRADGTLTFGDDSASSAFASAQTTVANPGAARSYPTVRVFGPSAGGSGQLFFLRNITTGRTIYLNLGIPPGDVATLTFQPDALSFTSLALGSVADSILPGSSEADFFLAPGDNSISVYAPSGINAMTITWHPAYTSLDQLP